VVEASVERSVWLRWKADGLAIIGGHGVKNKTGYHSGNKAISGRKSKTPPLTAEAPALAGPPSTDVLDLHDAPRAVVAPPSEECPVAGHKSTKGRERVPAILSGSDVPVVVVRNADTTRGTLKLADGRGIPVRFLKDGSFEPDQKAIRRAKAERDDYLRRVGEETLRQRGIKYEVVLLLQ